MIFPYKKDQDLSPTKEKNVHQIFKYPKSEELLEESFVFPPEDQIIGRRKKSRTKEADGTVSKKTGPAYSII
jgi:hypothetical protein